MTTGRINQVTVRHAPPGGGSTTPVLVRSPTLSQSQSSLPERSIRKSHLSGERTPYRSSAPPFGGASVASGDCRAAQPSPPISQVPGAVPESGGLGSAPSMKTSNKRPPSTEGCTGCGGSPNVYLQSRFGHRQSNPHPPSSPAEARTALQD
jgi:hypothetical protein